MKPNWGLIAGGVLFTAAVFAVAVLEGFNAVSPPAYAATDAVSG